MMDPVIRVKRPAVLNALVDALQPLPWTHSMWEAGAAAFDRLDEWSDIDLLLVVEDERVDEAFERIRDTLLSLSPLEIEYVLPRPTWHGHAQAFYRMRDAGEFLLLDLVVMRLSDEDRFLEPERHGTAIVHFDKPGIVQPKPIDPSAWRIRLEKRIQTLQKTFPLFQMLTKKEIERGNEVEALIYYHGNTLRPLVEVLRIAHDPYRHDYHVRYIKHDLPSAFVETLGELYFVKDLADLAVKRERAEDLFHETLATIDLERPAALR